MESHMVEDHVHSDPGHSHADAGHSHVDAGHNHQYTYKKSVSGCGAIGYDGCNDHLENNQYASSSGKANIQASKANIQSSKSNIGGMANGSKGTETRPINMRVLWIMKAW